MNRVNKENMYQIIKTLEGSRHILDENNKLKETAVYIESEFISLGYDIHKHNFKVKGLDDVFTNITASIGDLSQPSLLIGAHYDTVSQSPGANDNLSGVALMLEVARVVAESRPKQPIKFCAFTLEEGHPGFEKAVQEGLQSVQILDDKAAYQSLNIEHDCWTVLDAARKEVDKGQPYSQAFKDQLNHLEGVKEDYAQVMMSAYEAFESEFHDGSKILTGSSRYVDALDQNNIRVDEVIVFDCLGWYKKDKMSQKPLPIGPEMMPLVSLNNVKLEESRGDYIGIFANMPASHMLTTYLESCSNLDVAYLGMHLPLAYDQLKIQFSDALRSDHAPFWKAGIKGLFVTDFANFRSELYHTSADRYSRIDYKMLERMANATLHYIQK